MRDAEQRRELVGAVGGAGGRHHRLLVPGEEARDLAEIRDLGHPLLQLLERVRHRRHPSGLPFPHAPVAQWTERRTSNPRVGGSNPPGRISRVRWEQAVSDPAISLEFVAARPLQGAVRPSPRARGAPRRDGHGRRGRALADRDDLRRGRGGLRGRRLAAPAGELVLDPVRDGRCRGRAHRLHVRVPRGRPRRPRRQARRAAGGRDRRRRVRDVHSPRRVRGGPRGARGSRRPAGRGTDPGARARLARVRGPRDRRPDLRDLPARSTTRTRSAQ